MPKKYPITNQRDLRAAFWEDNPTLDRKKIKSYSGNDTMYVTDTRCAFVDWIDMMCRDGQISDALAQRATL